VKLLVVDIIHPQNNKSGTVVENQATGDPKLDDIPDIYGTCTHVKSSA